MPLLSFFMGYGGDKNEKSKEKLVEEIYLSMNENERFGLEFGLFPYEKCKDLSKESIFY